MTNLWEAGFVLGFDGWLWFGVGEVEVGVLWRLGWWTVGLVGRVCGVGDVL